MSKQHEFMLEKMLEYRKLKPPSQSYKGYINKMKRIIFAIAALSLLSCSKQEKPHIKAKETQDYHNVSIALAAQKVQEYQSTDTGMSSFGIEASVLRSRLDDPNVSDVRFYIGNAIDRHGITLYASYEDVNGKSQGVDEYFCPCPSTRSCCKTNNYPE